MYSELAYNHLVFLLALYKAEWPNPSDVVQSYMHTLRNVSEQYRASQTVPLCADKTYTVWDWITYFENELHLNGISPLKYRYASGPRSSRPAWPLRSGRSTVRSCP